MSDPITRSLEAFRDWITHFESRFTCHKDHVMDRIAEIEANQTAMATVLDHIATEMADLRAKLDAASQEDPRIAAIADHAAAILAKAQSIAPAPVVEDAPAAEAPVDQTAQ